MIRFRSFENAPAVIQTARAKTTFRRPAAYNGSVSARQPLDIVAIRGSGQGSTRVTYRVVVV